MKRASDSLGLEVQTAVSHHVVLGNELGSSGRRDRLLTTEYIYIHILENVQKIILSRKTAQSIRCLLSITQARISSTNSSPGAY